jgi:aspartate carbamoyltransferase catalytic subunit
MSKEYVLDIVERAARVYRELREGNPHKFENYLTGGKCNLVFSQESTRTYTSFEDALRLLGAESIVGFRSAKESSIKKGENIYHTIDTFVGQGIGSKFIIVRDPFEGSARWARISAFRSFAKKVREYAKTYRNFPNNLILPIIFNAGDGKHSHPSQLLLDCSAVYHKLGKVIGINFGECNDLGGSRVVSSHIDACGILGWKMHLCPFPGAGLNMRQKFALLKHEISVVEYESIQKMLSHIDLLYVNRYQFNLRGEETSSNSEGMFSINHPKISLDLIQPFNTPVLHARPIDKKAKEITADLYDHPLDFSGVQSDFGVATRMAMCMYAIDHRLFSLEGVIRSLNPGEIGFYKQHLDHHPTKEIKDELYTTSRLNNGFVIDHIPRGCGGVMSNLISKLYPDTQVVLSMNVTGHSDRSIPKDVIKLHVPVGFAWTEELDSITALFSEYTSPKSCRVSQFLEGKRRRKWSYRVISEGGDKCCNEACITNPDRGEDIAFFHHHDNAQGLNVRICPFCEMPQLSNDDREFSLLYTAKTGH